MNFNLHITEIVKKSFCMLGFVRRVMKPFSDPKVLLTLYNSYIRSRLDYCSPVWSPSAQNLIDKIERVQKRFVKFVSFQSGVRYDNFSYIDLCNRFKLTSLEARRNVSDLIFFNKLLTNKVNCPFLLSNVYFSVPVCNTRNLSLFHTIKKGRIKVRKTSYLPRTTILASSIPIDTDFFDANNVLFRKSVSVYFI